jgi:hypothetical protein
MSVLDGILNSVQDGILEGLVGDNFKAHDAKYGPKLDDSQRSGETEMQRRYREAEDRERMRVMDEREARRVAREVLPEARSEPEPGAARIAPSKAKTGRGRGRPRKEGVRPWEAEGISRTAWYQRRKGGAT